jgi:DNA-directed RNA polymerase specialized sigma24 family protein
MGINLDDLPARLRTSVREAFNELAIALGPRLRGFLRARGCSPADAEALAVSCLTDIALKIDRFTPQGPGSFEAWALRLTERVHNKAWQANRPDRTVPLTGAEANLEADPEPEVIAAVVAAVERLETTDREIVRLRLFGPGEPFTAIAAQVELTEGAARTRFHRALKELEEALSVRPEIQKWIGQLRPRSLPEDDT